jgi:Eco57I restriction-modification methylase
MSFDKPTRNALAKMVSECRRLLTADIRDQLQRIYGLQPDGTDLPVESLGHLDERGKLAAIELREWHEHLASTEPGPEAKRRVAAFDRVAHETAFTALDRLAALRLCEERGHVIECVRRGMESDGFKLFERLSGGALGSRPRTYQAFLERMFDELAVDLGVLFDRRVPQSLLFPTESCLERVLEVLNDSNLVHLWQDDETIGWIYQYFNPKEERDAMRKASQAPRNSRELAVRNQFFTPRYVVEFLTDNTLGRIWYEMRRGDTRLKERCRYLVRRPTEIFLEPDQVAPQDGSSAEDLNQGELLRRPVHVPFRPKKDPRDLKILDPACGSGHFLLYAFDLLEVMYEEAWDKGDFPPSQVSGNTLREDYPELDLLRREVPSLILRHNLYGLEIDKRCWQIAALALWLRAQRAFQKLDLKTDERPQITRSNIACAEPMPSERELLEEFCGGLKPNLLAQLVRAVFEKMGLAGEAGSLLKIEEEIRAAISEAKKQWLAGPAPEQLLLLPEVRRRKAEQLPLFDVSGISDETFWIEAEARLVEALREYATRATDGSAYRRRLFAEDAAEGFAFVDTCRKRFDVVLMNPPFGDFPKAWKEKARSQYRSSYNDIFAAFTERGFELLAEQGSLGAITSRVGFFLSSFSKWRVNFLTANGRLRLVADLGERVMDEAMVEAAAYCLERTPGIRDAGFFRLLSYDEERELLLAQAVESAVSAFLNPNTFWFRLTETSLLPDCPLVYWVGSLNLKRLTAHRCLDPALAEVKQGLVTGDNPRFVRTLWEVPAEAIGNDGRFDGATPSRWAPLVMKGASQPWYSPITVVVKWASGGAEIRNFVNSDGKLKSRPQNLGFYFRSGFSWTRRAVRFIPYAVPRGCIPTASRYMAFPKAGMEFASLGLTASNIASAFLRFYGEKFAWPNFLVEDLKLLPCPNLSAELVSRLANVAVSEVSRRRRAYQNQEPFQDFAAPSQCFPNFDLNSLAIDLSSFLGPKLEDEVAAAYGFSPSDAAEVERDLKEALVARRPAEERNNGTGDSDEADAETPISEAPRDRAHALISYALGIVFGRWDVRIGREPGLAPKLPGPFDPIPICQPGTLVGPEGLPAKPEGIVSEEWLQARSNVLSVPELNRLKQSVIPEEQYPVRINWNGILVDEPSHSEHIAQRVREVLYVLFSDRAESVEADACDTLGVAGLNDYFRRANGFTADHLAVYTKSGRQAPIYWQLSTKSGSYGLWIYYHRLNGDLVYKAVNDYVNPKIADTERQLNQSEDALASASGREATKLRSDFESNRSLLDELQDFKAELLRVAALPYKPNLNDGVLITAAPFWKLFRLPKWRRDLEECWKKLEAGEYDWAHLASSIWPERVREKCKTDRSLAIAHGLEELCEVVGVQSTSRNRRRATTRAAEPLEMDIRAMDPESSDE